MDKILKLATGLFVVVIIASIAVFLAGSPQQAAPSISPTTIYFFYGQECPHCEKIMPFMNNLTQKYPDANIQFLEVWHNQTNQKIYTLANAAAGVTDYGVPEVILGTHVLMGEDEIPANMTALVQDYLKKKQ
jgi:thiol-disulfide isomerase/thioredoxin